MAGLAGLTIREAKEADARAMLDYLGELTLEPGIPILLSHERALRLTIESEQELIRQHRGQFNAHWLLALDGSRIVGMLNMVGASRAESAHSVTLGVSVAKEWRDRGVGRELMTRAIEWARRTEGVSRVELEVFSDNARAIHLYERMGFAAEGVRRRAFIKDGVEIDSLMMALLL
jgi:RimJ/RimL family protein N-acetyltransferase